jgi:hypothetical protein
LPDPPQIRRDHVVDLRVATRGLMLHEENDRLAFRRNLDEFGPET